MDLIKAMYLWQEMGNTIVSWNTKDGYYTLFVKNNQVKGHTKAVAGGISWEWPEELMKHKES